MTNLSNIRWLMSASMNTVMAIPRLPHHSREFYVAIQGKMSNV